MRNNRVNINHVFAERRKTTFEKRKLLRKGDGASGKSKKLLDLWSMIDYLPVTRICGPDLGLQASNQPIRITGRDGRHGNFGNAKKPAKS